MSTPPPLRNRKRFRRNNRPKTKKGKKTNPESFILVLCVSLLDVPGSDCCSPYLERRSVTIISDPESIGLSITADRVRQSLSIVVRLGVALFNHRHRHHHHHHHHPFLFDCFFFLFIYFLFFSWLIDRFWWWFSTMSMSSLTSQGCDWSIMSSPEDFLFLCFFFFFFLIFRTGGSEKLHVRLSRLACPVADVCICVCCIYWSLVLRLCGTHTQRGRWNGKMMRKGEERRRKGHETMAINKWCRAFSPSLRFFLSPFFLIIFKSKINILAMPGSGVWSFAICLFFEPPESILGRAVCVCVSSLSMMNRPPDLHLPLKFGYKPK